MFGNVKCSPYLCIRLLTTLNILTMEKYVLVCWPESQMLMDVEWFDECILMNDMEHLADIGSSAYFVPEDRYLELKSKKY